MACIADVLGAFAGDNGLRSGPGRNERFMVGLSQFENEQYNAGISLLAAFAYFIGNLHLSYYSYYYLESAAIGFTVPRLWFDDAFWLKSPQFMFLPDSSSSPL